MISQERLEALIQKHNLPNGVQRPPYPGPNDFKAALSDYFQLSRQHLPDAEPMARAWRRDRLSIAEVRDASGLSSSDFGSCMESAVSELLQQRFSDLSGDLRAITGDKPLDNFLPTAFASLGLPLPGEAPNDGDLPRLPAVITESTEKGVLRTYAAKLGFSYSVWTSHGAEILAGLNDFAAMFALLEASRLVSILENSTLPTSASSGLDLTGLNKVNLALRSQENSSGQVANLAIKSLVVPAQLEFSASTLLQSAGKADSIRLVILPGLASQTTWWAVCDPSISAPLARLTLRGSRGPKLFLNRRKGQAEGIEFCTEHDFNFCYLSSMPGIIKATA